MRTIKRILKIHSVKGYEIACLFNNGESRIIDFKELFKKWAIKMGDVEFPLVQSREEFEKVKLSDGTLAWENIILQGSDDTGEPIQYTYDLDPIVLYENSRLDESRQIEIGLLIRQVRNELSLTQEELAARSGTTKHYISRVENNRTGIELATLVRIIEGGLGKKMKISIQE
ncbi:helix-turn-helix domain-containing protein [Arundinibacter roseus]|uniref:Helix-turn-helix domain-containing protein n=1 Tax=Arundinibacter roseus TaxID=2070510 RepID=A0A4R4KBZ1_9BACT|nr:helix-turn-helix domain-containing protein [Arundinibacter roseus]TDB63749.1 helix-turn-helix domain-containing protein [Arundinibacter roseus]